MITITVNQNQAYADVDKLLEQNAGDVEAHIAELQEALETMKKINEALAEKPKRYGIEGINESVIPF
jgi:hypothetical protein